MAASTQRGLALIEALIAFVVLSLGMLGIARVQDHLHALAANAQARSEAVRLAQEDLERLRARGNLVSANPDALQAQATRYQLEREVSTSTSLKTVNVAVSWPDRTGKTHEVKLMSALTSTSPDLSGALVVQSPFDALHPVQGRSPVIPAFARDLGEGRSVLASADGAFSWIFNNKSGQITALCSGLLHKPTAADVARSCTPVNALLLSGWIRFSQAPRPLSVSVALDDSSREPMCWTDARGPALAYHCAIDAAHGAWSGRSVVAPQGWTLGDTAEDYKVCRYAEDQDASGAIDRNAEHPQHYEHVELPLIQQNFLIIRGDQSCAVASTMQHQP